MTAVASTSVDPLAPATLGAHATRLLQRDRWSREELADYQRERLRALIRHAVERSPYYRAALGPDAETAELSTLPTMPKRVAMEQFDRIVTDRRLRLADLEPFLARADAGALYLGEYHVFSTSGTSGVPGLFLYSQAEFAHWVAVFIRSFARLGMTPETRIVGLGAPSALHLSQQVIAAMQAGRGGAPRLSVATPVDEMVAALNAYQPEVVGGYPSVIALLAEEQLQGRLEIAPRVVLTTSEVLTEDAAARIRAAWTKPVEGYFTTEVGVVAAGSLDHVGLHVCEEAIVEVVDAAGDAVPPGQPGAKVLLTNLVNHAQPLIRYELLDTVELAEGPDPSGRPFDRIAHIDGRSDDVLRLPASDGAGTVAVHPYRLRAPFVRLLDVLQYQIVQRREGLTVLIVVRPDAPRDLPDRVRSLVENALQEAGAACAVRVEVVQEIARERGHAAKLKLVRSELGDYGMRRW
jgi:phenylacetate-coenzyme A ligase PaaK-like adenylate-forming protein